jgi:hypothetical protein
MVEKCANPACSATFLRLRDGRVFIEEIEALPASDGKKPSRQVHYHWLCNSCCRTMTIVAEKGRGIRVVPLPPSANAARVAS